MALPAGHGQSIPALSPPRPSSLLHISSCQPSCPEDLLLKDLTYKGCRGIGQLRNPRGQKLAHGKALVEAVFHNGLDGDGLAVSRRPMHDQTALLTALAKKQTFCDRCATFHGIERSL
jgi:hypothetical protein